ncbi:hypothetical protein ScPMuIL_013846 [Solemya velum]
MDVFCDLENDGGGWTVFQRRMDGSTNFSRGWTDYESGFGDLGAEFWLGNANLEILTRGGQYELFITMETFGGDTFHATYENFAVGDLASKYQLTVSTFDGDAGDDLSGNSGHSFSTHDQDNDGFAGDCAGLFTGGWWFNAICGNSNLNGEYLGDVTTGASEGVSWKTITGLFTSLKASEMKMRPFST